MPGPVSKARILLVGWLLAPVFQLLIWLGWGVLSVSSAAGSVLAALCIATVMDQRAHRRAVQAFDAAHRPPAQGLRVPSHGGRPGPPEAPPCDTRPQGRQGP